MIDQRLTKDSTQPRGALRGTFQEQRAYRCHDRPSGPQASMENSLIHSYTDRDSTASQSKDTTERYGTTADQQDMYRMGKTQKLRRNFGFFSIFGFSMILLSTWEIQLGTAAFGMANGGTAGLIWVYLGILLGFLAVIASMAEMASMAPTAGGQYHWVSEFAPKKYQKFLSYIVGWLCVLGWQTGSASSAFLAGMEIQALLILNMEDYTPQAWHGTLIVVGLATACGLFNVFLARRLPFVEGLVLVLHVLGFFAILIPLWVLAPRSSAQSVFTEFSPGAWSNTGLACLVGVIGPTVSLIGSDAATHMAEELRDAAYVLPRAMLATALVNGSMGFVMLVTFCFCVGDFDAVLGSKLGLFGYPFVEVFRVGTQSEGAATVMTCILIVLSTFCCITNIATASRQLFAFARDHGVPFSSFFAYIPPGWDIPLRSIVLTLIVSTLLSLINIGSRVAYNNITSLGVNALLSSYIVSIACVCVRRWQNKPLLHRRFSLGRFGFAINVFSVAFLSLVWIMCFFPSAPNPAPEYMNWSVLIYGAVVLFSLVYYAVKGHRVYDGPVEYVRREQ